MTTYKKEDQPHRRYNPLTGEWVLISPQRGKRPWSGKVETKANNIFPIYDPTCYLCPNNTRVSGEKNPDYDSTYVFKNDFSALLDNNLNHDGHDGQDLFCIENIRGLCKVICYSPDHSKTLAELSIKEIETLIHTWISELQLLSKNYIWIQIFENKGEIMGCSQPHPHGQIWANSFVPNQVSIKNKHLYDYFQKNNSSLLLDYALKESQQKIRTIVENDHWIVVIPFWAAWPFETLLMPKFSVQRMEMLSNRQQKSLAEILKKLTIKYDNLFECRFPYSMGWHYAPYFKQEMDIQYWQLHAVFYPPLLRNAFIKKFMVGYEMLCESQRDITAEQAAEMLRNTSNIHYRNK